METVREIYACQTAARYHMVFRYALTSGLDDFANYCEAFVDEVFINSFPWGDQ